MTKCYLLFSTALLTASVTAASDTGKFEAFLGYNLVHFDPNAVSVPSFNVHGGDAQFVHNFTPSISAVLDVGVVASDTLFGVGNNITGNRREVDHSVVNFVLGPRYSFRQHRRLVPFAQALFGGARAKSSTTLTLLQGGTIWPPPGLNVPPGVLQPIEATVEAERTGFAMILGGGIDIKIGKHIAFRPIGADYYMTRLPGFITGNDTNKHHFRYSAGINFQFGAR